MKNKLSDLNNHLFAQLERLSQEDLTPEQIKVEIERGEAVAAIADQIVRSSALQITAARLVAEHGDKVAHRLPLLETSKQIEVKPS
jgi:hypothetical protein